MQPDGDFECAAVLQARARPALPTALLHLTSPSPPQPRGCSHTQGIPICNPRNTQGHPQDVKALAWHPEEERLVSCSYDDSLKVWVPDDDGDDWRCAQTLSRDTCGEARTRTVGREHTLLGERV